MNTLFSAYPRAIRVHQWIKNALVFFPLLTSHEILNAAKFNAALAAWFALSLVASAGYVINDIVDLPHDRKHDTKRHRPLASGKIRKIESVALVGGLLCVALAIAVFQSWKLPVLLCIYLICSVLYTLYFKKKVLFDAFFLAFLYTYRVVIGLIVADLSYSTWMIAFCVFFFLGLAFLKRAADLPGKGYAKDDFPIIAQFGITSSYLSVLIFALYIASEKVVALYSSPLFLWAICPLLLFWNLRCWWITYKGKMNDDPVLFAVRDPFSWATLSLGIGIVAIATLL